MSEGDLKASSFVIRAGSRWKLEGVGRNEQGDKIHTVASFRTRYISKTCVNVVPLMAVMRQPRGGLLCHT